MTRASSLREHVRTCHPARLLEPLDATAPTDLAIVGPTVVVEIVGAREALDALARVRRVAPDVPVAAVRVAVPEVPSEPPRLRPTWRRVVVVVGLTALVVGVVLAARRGSSVVETAVPLAAVASAPVLVVAALAAWRRGRRAPMERRRHFERRRSIAVIAVPSPDETSATSLAAEIRHQLGNARTGDHHVDVSVVDPIV